MKENLKKGGIYLLQVMLTACASVLVAMLQNYIATHSGQPAEILNPSHVGAIGTVLSGGHVTYKQLKFKLRA